MDGISVVDILTRNYAECSLFSNCIHKNAIHKCKEERVLVSTWSDFSHTKYHAVPTIALNKYRIYSDGSQNVHIPTIQRKEQHTIKTRKCSFCQKSSPQKRIERFALHGVSIPLFT